MMKLKVRFRLEKALLASKGSICVCLYCHSMASCCHPMMIWEETKISFYSSFFGSSDNDEERRINRGMYEWH